MKRALLISDTHNEYDRLPIIPIIPDVDFLIMAGDIGGLNEQLDFIKKQTQHYKVIYVLGNHEFYGQSLQSVRKFWREVNIPNFYFLDNTSVVIDGIQFIGSTLWTDFDNQQPLNMVVAPNYINDYEYIMNEETDSFITPFDILEEFKISLDFIKKELMEQNDYVKVVVTHFAPSFQSIPHGYKNASEQSLFKNSFYASNLDNLIYYYGPHFWFHGHIHATMKYTLGNTHVETNPLGRPTRENEEFDYYKVINLIKHEEVSGQV